MYHTDESPLLPQICTALINGFIYFNATVSSGHSLAQTMHDSHMQIILTSNSGDVELFVRNTLLVCVIHSRAADCLASSCGNLLRFTGILRPLITKLFNVSNHGS